MGLSHPILSTDLAAKDAALLHGRRVALVDTRFPEEIELFGPLPGAHNLPLSRLQRFAGVRVNPPCERYSAQDLTPVERRDLTRILMTYASAQATVLCVCRSGQRSAVAARIIRNLGHRRTVSLQGGLVDWGDWIRTRFTPAPRTPNTPSVSS